MGCLDLSHYRLSGKDPTPTTSQVTMFEAHISCPYTDQTICLGYMGQQPYSPGLLVVVRIKTLKLLKEEFCICTAPTQKAGLS